MSLFKKKINSEMPPSKASPNLGVSYGMKKKKMARGGEVKAEKSIDPEDKHEDKGEEARNSGEKKPVEPKATDNTWSKFGKSMSLKQTRKPAPLPIGPHKVNDRELAQEEYKGLLDETPESPSEPIPSPMADGGQVGADMTSPHTGETQEDMLRRHAMELASSGFAAPSPNKDEFMAGHFTDGGMVDLNANSEEGKNLEDDLSWEALEKEMYDDAQLASQPSDSNLKGDPREEDAEDDNDSSIVGKIRKKYKK